MTAPEPDALDIGLELAGVLEERGIPYALGGALALGVWGIPRGTHDVDVNVFVSDAELPTLLEALRDLGIEIDEDAARMASRERGLIVVRHRGMRVDLFTPSIDFSWEAERTRKRHTVEGRGVWFLSAEALAVFKLLFFRAKDIVDLERLIAVQGSRFDAAYVRRHLVEMMGDDDPRVVRLDDLVSRYVEPP